MSTTAHTVCNLLTTLNLSSSQLLYDNNPKSVQKFVKETDATISSVVSALQYMTLLDKLQKGQILPSFVQTDITKLLYNSITNKRNKWPGADLSLHGQYLCHATDSFFLELVISELLDNSCRYRSSHIKVFVDQAKTKTRIIVADDGEGIEKDELPKVFDPYFRIKKHQLRSRRAGLGLTTVREVASKLNGQVKLDSSPEWGTRVELVI